jgi:hypothetical protein
MRRTNLLVAVLLVLVVGGATFWLTVRRASLPRAGSPRSVMAARPPVDPGIALHRPHLAPAPPEPTFGSREQTVRYYGTLVEGERRALAVVEEALSRTHGGGAEWEHSARLQAMRTDYQQRIQRHQARLDAK